MSSTIRTILLAPVAKRTWLDFVYLFVGTLLFSGWVLLVMMLFTSAFFMVTLIGVPILALTLLGTRYFVGLHREAARGLLGVQLADPPPHRPARGFFDWLGVNLRDAAGWKAVGYVLFVSPIKSVAFYVVALGWVIAGAHLTYPIWWAIYDPTNVDSRGEVRHSGEQWGEFYFDTWPRALALSALGFVMVLAMPWVVRAFAQLDAWLVRVLLGPGRVDERVRDLEETRAAAVDESAATLRRIERDLHDGTQARLVAMAMQLDMAKEKLGTGTGADVDVERARELLDTAHRNATEAMTELRDMTRNIHPPALDRGLDAALATLASRSGLGVELHTDIRVRPSPAIETIAYFCVAELLTNVTKHSGARRAAIDVRQVDGLLRLRVSDNGPGGAQIRDGGGLAGLGERIRTVDGRLELSSPPGGPTVVTVELPQR